MSYASREDSVLVMVTSGEYVMSPAVALRRAEGDE